VGAVGVKLGGAGVARAGDAGAQVELFHCTVDNAVRHHRRANDLGPVIGRGNLGHSLHCVDDGLLEGGLRVGAIALAKPQVHIHRFGSKLNEHVHFHVCVVDWVFEEVEFFNWTTLEQPLVTDRFVPSEAIHCQSPSDSYRQT
jgi:hypothetical protein